MRTRAPSMLSVLALTGLLAACRQPVRPWMGAGAPPGHAPPGAPGATGPWPGGVQPPNAPAAAPPEHRRDCDGDLQNGPETDVRAADAHCGSCGNACGKGLSCIAGGCRAPQVMSAWDHTVCAVAPRGVQPSLPRRVMCWGEEPGGRAGPAAEPVWIPGTEGAASVALGHSGACAVLATGRLLCWERRADARVVEQAQAGVVDVDLGIARPEIGYVRSDGRLLDIEHASSGDIREVKPTSPLADVRQIAAGSLHACALLSDGTVRCWGKRSFTGAGKGGDGEIKMDAPVQVKGLAGAVRLSASDRHTCALGKDGSVSCWGRANLGGLPGAPTSVVEEEPTAVPGIADAVDVAAGHDHTCVLRASGKVSCWGVSGLVGELGGGPDRRDGLVEVQGISDAVAVVAGDDVSCAYRASGKISCWGTSSRGQLGNGTMGEVLTPKAVPGVSGATQIGAGDGYTCAVVGPGAELSCWGIGQAFWDPRTKLGPPAQVSGITGVARLSAAKEGACAVNEAGKVACFAGKERRPPHGSPPVKGAKRVFYDSKDTGAALLQSGGAALWYRTKTTPVPGLEGAVDLAYHNHLLVNGLCAVLASGKVACVTIDVPFGKKTPAKPSRAVEVGGLGDAMSIAAGQDEYCAVRKSGRVACWEHRALEAATDPDASGAAPLSAADVPGVAGATQVAVSRHAACALLGGGTVMCWGTNHRGQRATGDLSHREQATAVPGLADATAVAMGEGHACALRKGGEVVCWGDNEHLAVGQADPPYAFTPVDVRMPAP